MGAKGRLGAREMRVYKAMLGAKGRLEVKAT